MVNEAGNQKPAERPDIAVRVFMIKLKELMFDNNILERLKQVSICKSFPAKKRIRESSLITLSVSDACIFFSWPVI